MDKFHIRFCAFAFDYRQSHHRPVLFLYRSIITQNCEKRAAILKKIFVAAYAATRIYGFGFCWVYLAPQRGPDNSRIDYKQKPSATAPEELSLRLLEEPSLLTKLKLPELPADRSHHHEALDAPTFCFLRLSLSGNTVLYLG